MTASRINQLVPSAILYASVSICHLSAQTLFTPNGSVGAVTNGTGNVGIGTSTPSASLEIRKDHATEPVVRISNGQPTRSPVILEFQGDYNATGILYRLGRIYAQASGSSWIDSRVTLQTIDSNGAYVDTLTANNGKIGVGTINPGAKLDIGGPTGSQYGTLALKQSASGEKGIWIQSFENNNALAIFHTSGAAYITTDYTISGTHVPLLLQTTGGSVGIGTTSPSGKLEAMGGRTYLRSTAEPYTLGIGQGGYTGNFFLGASASNAPDLLLSNNAGTELMRVKDTGNVGIGTTNPSHKLSVNGSIRAGEVIVDTGWSDYVFAPDYELAPLSEVEAHIKEHQHLPGIPAAKKVAEEGVSVGEMQARLLAKIEELTLHVIAQEKRAEAQAAEITALRAQVADLAR